MPTAPPLITPYATPPSSGDPTNFDARADAKVADDVAKVSEYNALGANVFANATEAATSATAAGTARAGAEVARDAAAASATDAAASAGAAAWVSGATYAIGDRRRSLLDGRVYRRTTAGAGTVDPANDTANWVDQVVGARVRITGATVLQVRTLYELDSSAGSFNVTLPATFGDTDWIDFVDVGLALGTNPVTVQRNGNNIRRVPEDLVLDVAGDSLRLLARTSLGWIEQ